MDCPGRSEGRRMYVLLLYARGQDQRAGAQPQKGSLGGQGKVSSQRVRTDDKAASEYETGLGSRAGCPGKTCPHPLPS